MSELDWERVWRIFDEALEAPESGRPALLEQRCVGDSELRAEIEGLLAGHQRDGVLDRDPTGRLSLGGLGGGAPPAKDDATSVGPYRIVREVGRGGMGVVYLAEDPRHNRQAALKLIAPHLSADPQARRRLLAEARAASRLDHPNICEILEVSETDDGRLFLAMPFYEGETLHQRIERGAVPLSEALEIAVQAASGLERAHAAGIVHRDIKPSNLLLTPEGVLKLLDFGVAKVEGASLSNPGVRVGTLSYMAPEQLLGETVSPAADLWALGVTLYEMTTGRRPFQGEYEPAVMYEILNEEPPPARSLCPELPNALDRLLGLLLEKNAGRRLGSAADLVAELRALQRGDEIRVGQRGAPQAPPTLTTFLGRERELELLERIIESARLATLTGPAGAGKTRLAIEASRRLAPAFPEGVWFVSLASAQNRAQAMALIGRALGVHAGADEAETIELVEDSLRGRKALLVLDNCEQVMDCGVDVGRLLSVCTQLRVVATSRTPLRLSGERELLVPPFDPPSPDAPVNELEQNHAVALFLDRARALQPAFTLDESNAAAIAGLCVRLDGLPLAIELAAARIKLFSPKALLGRLGGRLDLLSTKGLDRPARHRTLRKAIEWSYELLGSAERTLFRRLAVFRGGCDLEALRQVCSDCEEAELLDALDALLQHSLVRRIDDSQGDSRFDMLETIRELALEQLTAHEEAVRIRQSHADYYRLLAVELSVGLTGPSQGASYDRFDAEAGNLQAALDWSVERRDPELGLRLATAIWRYWLARGGIDEGAARFEALLAMPLDGLEPRLLAEALHDQSTLEQNRGHNLKAAEIMDRCIVIWRELGDERGVADALANQAWVDLELTRLDRAETLSQEALEIHTRIGAVRGAAVDWNNLGWASVYRGRMAEAFERYEKGLELRRQAGDSRGEGYSLASLAWVEQLRGRFDSSHRLLDQASRRLLRIGDRVLLGYSLVVRATALLDAGRLAEASEIAEKAVREWERGGNRSGEAWTQTLRGEIDTERGRLDSAVERLEGSRRVWSSLGGRWGEAMALTAMSRAYLAAGRDREARTALRSALELRRDVGDERGVAECLELSACLAAENEPAIAAELAATAAALRLRLDAPRPRRRLLHPVLDTPPDPRELETSLESRIATALSVLG